MALADRLKDADDETKDIFAAGRAALDGYKQTGLWTPDGLAAVKEMIHLRGVLGWEGDD